jgi:hypothetical protein
MFATAALADAKMKDSRRKHWDRAIEEAKAGSNPRQPMDQPEKDLANVTDVGIERPMEGLFASAFDAYEQVVRAGDPIASISRGTTIAPFAAQLKIIDAHMRQSTIPIEFVAKENVEPNSHRGRDPQTRVHLDKLETMVARLVTRLLVETRKYMPNGALVSSPVDNLRLENKAMQANLERLQARTTRLPSYHCLETANSNEERQSLNNSIEALIGQRKTKKNIYELMAKICYNLLISTAPPNVETYTVMIKHFTRLELHHLSEVVIDSFYNDSVFTPNQDTVSAILGHYIDISDRSGFKRTIQRMRGASSDMRIRKRSIYSLSDPNIQQWALSANVIHRNGYLVEKVTRDSQVFTNLIYGCLKFSMPSQAIMYTRAAFRQGIRVSADVLRSIMAFCIESGDKKSAANVLAIIAHQMQAFGGIKFDAACREYIFRTLSYCGIEYSLLSGEFRGSLLRFKGSAIKAMLQTLHLEELQNTVSRANALIVQLGQIVERGSSNPASMVENLLECIDASSQQKKSLVEYQLEKKMDDLNFIELQMKDIKGQLAGIVHSKLSPTTKAALESKRRKLSAEKRAGYHYLEANIAAWEWERRAIKSTKVRGFPSSCSTSDTPRPLAQAVLQHHAKTAEDQSEFLVGKYLQNGPAIQYAVVEERFSKARHGGFPLRRRAVSGNVQAYGAYDIIKEEGLRVTADATA